jgi:quercetin dioxygenase-like cupin family protein
VRFGGDNGEAIDVMAGDVVVLPAGTVPTSRAVRSRPDLSLKPKVNLHPSSILVRGSPL